MWFNTPFQWAGYLGARGLGVYDVALTWRRSRVQFSPSPPLINALVIYCYLPFRRQQTYYATKCDLPGTQPVRFSGSGNLSSSTSTLANGNSSSSDIEKSVEPPCQVEVASLSSKSSSGMA